jgi:hypothetical protein
MVDEILPEWGVGQLFGRAYSGKTFVAIDLAMRLANGLPDWHGHAINRCGDVVYVLMEGAFDFQQRVDAWLAANPGANDDRLYTLEEQEVDLLQPSSLDQIKGDIAALDVDPVLVVVDTQSLASSAEENDNSQMNRMLGFLKLFANALGCVVLLVHHTGHAEAERGRGASAQFAAMDVVLRVHERTVSATKVKAYKPSAVHSFVLEESGESVWARPASMFEAAAQATQADAQQRNADSQPPSRELLERVLSSLAEAPAVSKSDLATRLGGNRAQVLAAINHLIARGAVEVDPRGNAHQIRLAARQQPPGPAEAPPDGG